MRETSPYPLTTQCACMDDEGRIWMVSNMVNGLFCLDPDTGKTEYVTSFEREPLFCGSLYTKAFWYKGNIWFILTQFHLQKRRCCCFL